MPTLERIIVGGAPLPPALMERIEQRLGVTVQTSWGMTELSPSGTVAPPDDACALGASVGPPRHRRRPAAHRRRRPRAAASSAASKGICACAAPRSSSAISATSSSATDADGWFPTGDLARIDAAGNLIITGRAKDLIKSGGEWINPAEIEAVVSALPEVSLAAVIGRPHLKWGERPILLVQMRDAEHDQRRGLAGAAARQGRAVVDSRRGHPRAAHASVANG